MKLKIVTTIIIIVVLLSLHIVNAKELKIGVTPSVIFEDIKDIEIKVDITIVNQSIYNNLLEKQDCDYIVNLSEKENWIRIDEKDNNFILKADEIRKVTAYIKKPIDIEINKEYKVSLDVTAIPITESSNQNISAKILGTIAIPIFLKDVSLDNFNINANVVDAFVIDNLEVETIFSLTSKLILFNRNAYSNIFSKPIKFKINNKIVYDTMLLKDDFIIFPIIKIQNNGDITLMTTGIVELYNDRNKKLDSNVYSYTVIPSNNITEIKSSINLSDYANGKYLLNSNVKLHSNIDNVSNIISFEMKNLRWICILLFILFYILLITILIIIIKVINDKKKKRKITKHMLETEVA